MTVKRKRNAIEATLVLPPSKKLAVAPLPPSKNHAVSPPLQPAIYPQFQEDPKGPHKKRETELYAQLSSEYESERTDAAIAFIQGLFGQDLTQGVSEPTLLVHIAKLMRGLASGAKCARQGRFLVITEVLKELFGQDTNRSRSRYTATTLPKLLDLLKEKLKPEGDLSGQELRDHALGMLFGLQTFIQSGVLFDSASTSEPVWSDVLAALLALSTEKPWMREACGQVILQALSQVDQGTAETTLALLYQNGLAPTPEGVGIWLSVKQRFPDVRFPNGKPWGSTGNPLDHLKHLAKALKESSAQESVSNVQQVKQTGSWKPRPHFAWDLVLQKFIADEKVDSEVSAKAFENFWKVAVDESLFADSASPERKFWGFVLFQDMLGGRGENNNDLLASPALLQHIFSPNLIRCLINHAVKEDRKLNGAANKTLRQIIAAARRSPPAIPTIVSGLLDGGNYSFDRLTNSKTIEGVLASVTGSEATAVIHVLLEHAKTLATRDEKDAEARRQLLGDHLLALIRRIGNAEENDFVKDLALPILADIAYSNKGHAKKHTPALSEKTRGVFRNRLESAFGCLLSSGDGNVYNYPVDVLQSLRPDAVAMDSSIEAGKDKALQFLAKLTKKLDKRSNSSRRVFALVYSLMVFQLLNGEADAISVLDELKVCYDKFGKKPAAEDDESSVLLAEILLSLVSRPSKLLKKTAQLVLEAVSATITDEGLGLMIDVLETSESLKGQQEMFDQEDELDGGHDHAEENTEEDNGDELDSDVEIIDVEDASMESDAESSASKMEEDDDDGEDGDRAAKDTAENLALDAALEAALGTHRLDKDLLATASDSDSDADMTDSEMLELDNKLVEIFSARKAQPNKKKEKKEARENIVNFKSSVLDLLAVFVKKQPWESLGLLIPLLVCIRTTTARDRVGVKAQKVIVAIKDAIKKIVLPSRTKDAHREQMTAYLVILIDLHTIEAAKDSSTAFIKSASTASLTLAGCILKTAEAAGGIELKAQLRDGIVDVYAASLKRDLAAGRVHSAFFHELVNWCQSLAA